MSNPNDLSPPVGYQVIEWDMRKPPDERAQPLTRTQELKLSAMTLQPDRELTEYTLVDSNGITYTQTDLNTVSDSQNSLTVDDVIATITESTEQELRIALAQFAGIATTDPEACTAAVDPLVDLLPTSVPAVQGEILGILTHIANATPESTEPAVGPTLDLLGSSTHPLVQDEALSFLVPVAEHDPSAVTAGIPKVAAALRDDSIENEPAAHILAAVSEGEPDALIDVVPKIELFLETEETPAHVWALAAIGRLSKAHANIATEVIPTAARFINAETTPLRSNAVGVLADLADEYPTEVKPWVSDAIELLNDSDKLVRGNATSILARVGREYPDTVRPAADQLTAALDDDLVDTRFNACWALNYINATEALPALREIAATDPDEDVQAVAQLAIENLEE